MEYVIGQNGKKEILRTKGDTHTDLSGFQEFTKEYPDQTITDHFLIVRKTDSQEDPEGNCYDWYEINRHYRIVDKTKPVMDAVEKVSSTIGGERTDRLYEVGERFTLNGKLYKVALQIPAGGMIAVGANVEETDIATELSKLN